MTTNRHMHQAKKDSASSPISPKAYSHLHENTNPQKQTAKRESIPTGIIWFIKAFIKKITEPNQAMQPMRVTVTVFAVALSSRMADLEG